MKRGNPQPDPWGFLKPFTPYTWLGILLSGVAISLILMLPALAVRKKISRKQYSVLWTEYFFDIMGVFFSQGIHGVLNIYNVIYLRNESLSIMEGTIIGFSYLKIFDSYVIYIYLY